jgi:hypothetical protein
MGNSENPNRRPARATLPLIVATALLCLLVGGGMTIAAVRSHHHHHSKSQKGKRCEKQRSKSKARKCKRHSHEAASGSPTNPTAEGPAAPGSAASPVGVTNGAATTSDGDGPNREAGDQTRTVRGEYFAGQPSGVLLPAAAGVSLATATQCEGLGAGTGPVFGGIDQGPEAGSVRLALVPGGAMPSEVRCLVGGQSKTFEVAPSAASPGGVVADPIDSGYLTAVPFGKSSFWLQPWRAYLDTWPAARLGEAAGINFNVTAAEAPGTARLLGASGFRLARIEVSWNSLSYEDPSRFANEAGLLQKLVALRENGLRPLILLNANSGGPTPERQLTLTTVVPAAAGDRTVTLDPASAAAAVPGRTGFDGLGFGGASDVLITAVSGDVATLSRPLAAALPAGGHPGGTLLYGPFGPPKLANGADNPNFRQTLAGWLQYVETVCREAEAVFGAGGFDVEVWNELSFGSQFLDEANYYSPVRTESSSSVTEALLAETVAFLRNPANGFSPAIGISDGFASQTPFAAPAKEPPGVTALSKHLYRGPAYFPRTATAPNGPVNAFGGSESSSSRFVPSYTSALPEYFLTATQTETEIRDLAPFTSSVYGVAHGRAATNSGGKTLQTWMTEYNLNTNTLLPLEASDQDSYIGSLTDGQKERIQAEIVLRSLVSNVAKGMSREYFFAAAHSEGYSLISSPFIEALDANPSAYPGDDAGGPTTSALRRFLDRFAGPGPGGPARQLELLSIAQAGNHAAFQGDGTTAHPDLYYRDLLAVFPFQSAAGKFVVPVYVMTPNLTTVQDRSLPAGSLERFDLRDERFRVTLGNLPESVEPPTVSAYDPLRDESTPARFVSRNGEEAVFEMTAVQYPRLLTIEY